MNVARRPDLGAWLLSRQGTRPYNLSFVPDRMDSQVYDRRVAISFQTGIHAGILVVSQRAAKRFHIGELASVKCKPSPFARSNSVIELILC